MKLTINLNDAEVRGIKEYLKEVDDNEKPSKDDVTQFISSIVSGTLHAPQEAVSDYIRKYENG